LPDGGGYTKTAPQLALSVTVSIHFFLSELIVAKRTNKKKRIETVTEKSHLIDKPNHLSINYLKPAFNNTKINDYNLHKKQNNFTWDEAAENTLKFGAVVFVCVFMSFFCPPIIIFFGVAAIPNLLRLLPQYPIKVCLYLLFVLLLMKFAIMIFFEDP
jgi:hypothetical protein